MTEVQTLACEIIQKLMEHGTQERLEKLEKCGNNQETCHTEDFHSLNASVCIFTWS